MAASAGAVAAKPLDLFATIASGRGHTGCLSLAEATRSLLKWHATLLAIISRKDLRHLLSMRDSLLSPLSLLD